MNAPVRIDTNDAIVNSFLALRPDFNGLSEADVRKSAPSVFAGRGDPRRTTDRYGAVRTWDVAERLMADGWIVTNARQQRSRERDPRYQEHCLELAPNTGDRDLRVDEVVPRITLLNSANGRTKLRLMAGLFRLVCLNGLTVGTPSDVFTFRHVGAGLTAQLDAAVAFAQERVERAAAVAEEWRQIELSETRVTTFAQRAAELRFGSRAEQYAVEDVLAVRRPEDAGNVLWNVFNRAQENLTAERLHGTTPTGRAVLAAPVLAINRNRALNAALWQLGGEYAQAA